MTVNICVYHADCWDGIGAAYVTSMYRQIDHFIPANYSDDLVELIGPGEFGDIYIVDFSAPPHIIEELSHRAEHIHMMDHHKTAINRWKGVVPPSNVYIHFDITKSGTGIVWSLLALNPTDMPWWAAAIQDKDLWQFQIPMTKEIMASFGMVPTRNALVYAINRGRDHAISVGPVLLEQQQLMHQQLIKQSAYYVEFDGHSNIPCINISPQLGISEVLNILAQKAPFAIGWTRYKDIIKYSLRSGGYEDFDVALLAEQYGGGGHHNAAGFTISVKPYGKNLLT